MNFLAMPIYRRAISLGNTILPALGALLAYPVGAIADTPSASPLVCAEWETFTTQNGLPHNSIRTIRVVGGRVWVGTEGGLALYDGRHWKSWTQSDGLPSPVVSAIDMDTNTGEVWIGTWGGGLARFSAGRFDTFDQFTSGLAGDLVFAVRFINGRAWAATNGGVSVFDPTNDTWALYAGRSAHEPQMAFTSLNLIGDNLYMTGWGTGLQRFNLIDESWAAVGGPAGLVDPHHARRAGRNILESTGAERSLWLLTQDALFHLSPGQSWTALSLAAEDDASRFVRCLACPDQSQAWIGTSDGLRVLVDSPGDTWLAYRRDDRGGYKGSVSLSRNGRTIAARPTTSAIPDNRIRCIDFEPVRTTPDPRASANADGPSNAKIVWVGTVNGLARGSGFVPWSDLPTDTSKSTSSAPTRPALAGKARAKPTPRKQGYRAEAALPESIAIGLLGPRARTIPLPGGRPRFTGEAGRPDLLAVQLTLEEANTRGRHLDRAPYSLVTGVGRYKRYGWGNPDDDFATFLHADNAFGIVGFLNADGIIRNAVAWKTEVPFINVAQDPVMDQVEVAENPWVFRCFGDQPRRHRLLLDHLIDQRGLARLAALRTPGPLAKTHLDWYADHARDRRHPLVADLSCSLEAEAIGSALEVLRARNPEVVLTWCDTEASVDILLKMRKMGMDQLFVGSTQIVSRGFIESVGAQPGQVIALSPGRPLKGATALPDFAKQYTERNVVGNVVTPPSPGAYRSFDATDHLIEAINIAGPDREAIRTVLEQMSRSARGELHYERMHKPVRPMLARLEDGRWIFQTIP